MLLFPPQTWVWVWLGNQVGGGRLRAMWYRKTYRTQNICEEGDVCGGHWASGVTRGLGLRLGGLGAWFLNWVPLP